MGNTTISWIFCTKNLKKIQHLAFTDKVKIIKSYVPEKVKLFIENNLIEELKFFQKKYPLKIEILSDEKFIIPEYKIDLFNKSKKLINSLKILSKINLKKKRKKLNQKEIKQTKKIKATSKKIKTKKTLRTLWVRRKKIKLDLLIGELGEAKIFFFILLARKAFLPETTASLKALAINKGFLALAIALLIKHSITT